MVAFPHQKDFHVSRSGGRRPSPEGKAVPKLPTIRLSVMAFFLATLGLALSAQRAGAALVCAGFNPVTGMCPQSMLFLTIDTIGNSLHLPTNMQAIVTLATSEQEAAR
jgi:hypothetical protein